MRKAGEPGMQWHMSDVLPGTDFIMHVWRGSVLRAVEVRYREKGEVNKQARKPPVRKIDITVGVVMCRCIPDPPATQCTLLQTGLGMQIH